MVQRSSQAGGEVTGRPPQAGGKKAAGLTLGGKRDVWSGCLASSSPACGGGREGASGRAVRHDLVAGRPSPNPSRKREGR